LIAPPNAQRMTGRGLILVRPIGRSVYSRIHRAIWPSRRFRNRRDGMPAPGLVPDSRAAAGRAWKACSLAGTFLVGRRSARSSSVYRFSRWTSLSTP